MLIALGKLYLGDEVKNPYKRIGFRPIFLDLYYHYIYSEDKNYYLYY